MEKKLSSDIGFLPKIRILEKLVALDSDTYQSELSEAKEQLRLHDEKIEADKLARQKREAQRLAEKQKAIWEKTIGVWRDTRPYWNAKYTLLSSNDGFGELISI